MKILVLTDRFTPEIAAPCFRTMEHAREWVKLGHQVTVVTCVPNFPHGKIFSGYRNRFYQEEWLEGIRVIRVWSYMAANQGTVKRILDYASYMLSATAMCWRYPKFDVILATSPPLFVALAGFLVSRIRRRPWVFEIRDLWPATIQAVGALNDRVIHYLEKLEIFLYKKADRIISLTNSFRENLIERGIPAEKNDVVTNGVDTRFFDPALMNNDVRKELDIDENTFLVGYLGTVGLCQGLQTLVDVGHLLRHDETIKFIIVGNGADRAHLEELARRRGMTNIVFKDFVPHERVPAYLAALDASVIHLLPDPLFKTVIPSKLFENMAMGVPMIWAVDGESAQIVKKAGAGLCVEPGNAEKIAQAVRQLKDSPELRKNMSQAGYAVVRREYDRTSRAKAALRSLGLAAKTYRGR